MDVKLLQFKELDISAANARISISVKSAKLKEIILILCLKSEDQIKHQLDFTVLTIKTKVKFKNLIKIVNTNIIQLSKEKMSKRKLSIKPDLSKKTLVKDSR